MFLSHQTIERYIADGNIIITPEFDKKNIRPLGLRLHLGQFLLIPEPNQRVELNETQTFGLITYITAFIIVTCYYTNLELYHGVEPMHPMTIVHKQMPMLCILSA